MVAIVLAVASVTTMVVAMVVIRRRPARLWNSDAGLKARLHSIADDEEVLRLLIDDDEQVDTRHGVLVL